MYRGLLIFISCALSLAGCSRQDQQPPIDDNHLVAGVDPNYAPFEFRNGDTAGLEGFDIDLLREIGRANGWQLEFREKSFDGLLAALTGGEIDLAVSAITITPKRLAVVDFSDPYYLTGQSLVALSGNSTITDSRDLRGLRVGVQQGTTGEDLAKGSDGALVFRYEDIDEAFQYLADGELDAVINDYPSTRAYLDAHAEFSIVDSELNAEYYGIAVQRGKQDRLNKINDALAVLIGDGTYDSLHVKWFGYSWYEETPVDSLADL